MLNKVIKSGDKLDIKYLHQNKDKIYKSSVYDILDEDELEITIPTDEGKLILFHSGFEFQFFFYTGKGLFTCDAVVLDRYKRGNFYLLLVQLTTPLKKFQRREYYRLQCIIDFAYYKITDEVAELATTEEIFEVVADPVYISQRRLGRTKDLSGGGCRFLATEPLETGEKVLIMLRLANDKIDHMFYLVTEVITCEKVEQLKDTWMIRGKFEYKNKKERDLIVRYVFEEDRMLRKKENGE